jgi:hypothetical protein
MKLYSYKEAENFIARYCQAGGEALQLEEGCLGCGNWLLYDYSNKLRFFVINEIYLNCWSSAQTIRGYNNIPKKYQNIINEKEAEL